MDVHPTKNGINRYWSIPIFLWRYMLSLKICLKVIARLVVSAQIWARPGANVALMRSASTVLVGSCVNHQASIQIYPNILSKDIKGVKTLLNQHLHVISCDLPPIMSHENINSFLIFARSNYKRGTERQPQWKICSASSTLLEIRITYPFTEGSLCKIWFHCLGEGMESINHHQSMT